MNYLLKLQEKFAKWPFGQRLFSRLAAGKAPYFKTIKPSIVELRHNYIKVSMKKRPAVHNHLKTVHAIAACNLCEFAAGICMEASVPKHRRWIPVGMEVAYVNKANTDLSATCDLSFVEWDTTAEVPCYVEVKDTNGLVVVTATIKMKVSDKKK